MAEYSITLSRSARKDLERLEDAPLHRVVEKIESLARTPRPSEGKKVRFQQGLYRVRVGEYRVLFTVNDTLRHVDIVAVRHRRDAYRQR